MSQNSSVGLEKEDDPSLVKNVVDKACEASLLELITRHERLYYKVSQKYSSYNSRHGIPLDDISDDKFFIIYRAILAFDPSKNVKFSTWLGNFVRYHSLNHINKSSKFVKTEESSLEYLLNSKSAEKHENLKLKEENEFVFNILKQLKDKRIHLVFRLRYFSGEKKMTWARIAKRLSVSTQTPINLHDKGKKVLVKKYNTKNANCLDRV